MLLASSAAVTPPCLAGPEHEVGGNHGEEPVGEPATESEFSAGCEASDEAPSCGAIVAERLRQGVAQRRADMRTESITSSFLRSGDGR